MIRPIPIEVLVAAGYAVFLVVVAIVLERLARHSHQRSEQFQVAGFKFHKRADHWECPTGQLLSRQEIDHHRRFVRYQAPSHVCNKCHIKENCTDSDTAGRLSTTSIPGFNPSFGVSIVGFPRVAAAGYADSCH
jgi:hypothetical protein